MGKRIFLIGFMGSGKTTIGKLLAERLRWKFIDIDELIERKEGMNISEIFKYKGEPYFRKLERETLEEVIDKNEHTVVATGGGLGANPEALELMKKRGLVVWLDVDFEEFKRRCTKDGNRPLLRLGEKELKDLFDKRNLVYRQAHLRINASENYENILESIMENLPWRE